MAHMGVGTLTPGDCLVLTVILTVFVFTAAVIDIVSKYNELNCSEYINLI